jgi:hypothetical protein
MEKLLRFDGAERRSPRIDIWFTEQSLELRALAQPWFARMRACGGDVRELMHDGFATACLDDAPFAYVGIHKAHVSIGFFQGASLRDPAGLLEGTGKRMRHVKLKPGQAFDTAALGALVDAAYADMKRRLVDEGPRPA